MSEPLQKDKSNDRFSVGTTTATTIINDHKECPPPLSETDCNKNASHHRCNHPTHHHIRTTAFVNLLPPEYWAAYGQTPAGDSADDAHTIEQANKAINGTFIKRLQDLERIAPHALEAKLETYKEWVSLLQRLNSELLNDFDAFQRTIENQLQAHESRSDIKRDVTTLVRLIRQAYHYNNWCLADMKFETMTPAYVMGLDEKNAHDKALLDELLNGKCPPQKEQQTIPKKLSNTDMNDTNVKALAIEVAEKHDEINRLKLQLCCLEEEIQKAQKKIQFKDNVIRELRCDLKNLNKVLSQDKSNTSIINTNSSLSSVMVPIVTESLSESSTKPPRISNNLPNKSNSSDAGAMAENLEYLKNQLQEILSSSNCQIGNCKNEAERLRDIFMKLEADKIVAFERLKVIKENFLDIMKADQHIDHENVTLNDNDELFMQAVRDHIESLSLARKELSNQVQELLLEKAETAGKMEALNNMNRINCDALDKLADLLSSLTNEAFSYNEIYSKPNYNPFCQAVCNIKDKFSKTIEDLTAQLDAEREKDRQNKLAVVQLDKHDGSSDTKCSCITNRTTSPQQSHSTAPPIPHPRKKNKLLARKDKP